MALSIAVEFERVGDRRSETRAAGRGPQAQRRANRDRPASYARATSNTAIASGVVSANTETQSSDWQAGTTPRALSRPRVGFSPTRLLSPAGTRPEPAVSVPSEKLDLPARDDHR